MTRTRIKAWRESLEAYLFLSPALTILLVFQVFPLLYGVYISFFKWGLVKERFVGLGNYLTLARDPEFWRSLLVTIYYVLGVVPTELAIGLIVAVLLFQKIRGRSLYRLCYFLPFVTSMVVVGLVWRWMFEPVQGFINSWLKVAGLATPRWLLEPKGIVELLLGDIAAHLPDWAGGPSLALMVIMGVTTWLYLGFHIVILLAGLSNIPPDFYDAARVDGATGWQLFRHITLPLLSPTMFFLAIVATIGAFQAFSLVYVMTGASAGGYQIGTTGSSGEPLGTTRVITLFIFDNFYHFFKLGYGAAASVVLFVIIFILTLIQVRALGRRVFYLGG